MSLSLFYLFFATRKIRREVGLLTYEGKSPTKLCIIIPKNKPKSGRFHFKRFGWIHFFIISRLSLAANTSGLVLATFAVPNDAAVGTVSVVVVTATSQWDGTQNYARATVVVITDVRNICKSIYSLGGLNPQ